MPFKPGCITLIWSAVLLAAFGNQAHLLGRPKFELQYMRQDGQACGRLCAWVSGWLPSVIVSCSERAAHVHEKLGYSGGKFVIIPNGYDVSKFSPQPGARSALHKEWVVPHGAPVIGAVARWDPQKDHANLLSALALLAGRGVNFRCMLVGPGLERANVDLWTLIAENRLEDKVALLGSRNDIPAVMSALDLLVLSSYAEAFPNVVAEAMACGTPCVVTDVGDAALIVGNTGWVSRPRIPPALALSIETALAAVQSAQRDAISQACRQRIVETFGLERMASAYRSVWSNSLASQ